MLKQEMHNAHDTSWHVHPLVLSLAEFDDSDFEWIEDAWEALDVRICTLHALAQRDPQTWRLKLATLLHETARPRFTASETMRQIDRAIWDNELWLVAVNPCREYVGMTVLSQHPLVRNAYCARLTGVVPAYRRQSLATVLKVQAIRIAQLTGACSIETYADNELLELNLRLGFRPK